MEDPRIISALFIFLKMAYYNVLINTRPLKTFCICGRANTTAEPHRVFMIGLLLLDILKLCDYWEN